MGPLYVYVYTYNPTNGKLVKNLLKMEASLNEKYINSNTILLFTENIYCEKELYKEEIN